MRKQKLALPFHFAILVIFTATLSCNKDKTSTVLFKGNYSTAIETLQPPPQLKQKVTGTGTSEKINITKFVALSTVNLTTAPPFQVSGTATFYDGQGDEFYTNFTGTSTPRPEGGSQVEVTHVLASGTGKFSNATGSFVGKTTALPGATTGSISYEGFLSISK